MQAATQQGPPENRSRSEVAYVALMKGHALMENRGGLVVAATATKATGRAERKAAEEMIIHHSPEVSRITQGL
jgi:hypothetical protein